MQPKIKCQVKGAMLEFFLKVTKQNLETDWFYSLEAFLSKLHSHALILYWIFKSVSDCWNILFIFSLLSLIIYTNCRTDKQKINFNKYSLVFQQSQLIPRKYNAVLPSNVCYSKETHVCILKNSHHYIYRHHFFCVNHFRHFVWLELILLPLQILL